MTLLFFIEHGTQKATVEATDQRENKRRKKKLREKEEVTTEIRTPAKLLLPPLFSVTSPEETFRTSMATHLFSLRTPHSYFQRSHLSSRQIPSSPLRVTSSIRYDPSSSPPPPPPPLPSFSTYRTQTFLSPPLKPNSTRSVTAQSYSNLPLVSPTDHWGTWTVLFATGAFGLW